METAKFDILLVATAVDYERVTFFELIIDVYIRQRRQTAPALHLHAEQCLDCVDRLALAQSPTELVEPWSPAAVIPRSGV